MPVTARSLTAKHPGSVPVRQIIEDRPTCDEQTMCAWGFASGKFFVKYVNSACIKHSGQEVVHNGQRRSAA